MNEYYGTVEGFESYLTARGYEIPASDPSDVTAALLVASDWIDGRWGSAFRSSGTFKTGGRAQRREWPRIGYVDAYGYALPSGTVPREVEEATYEAAFRQISKPGILFNDYNAAKNYKQVSIDGAISVTYAGISSASDAQIVIPLIEQYLSGLIGNGNGTTSVTGYASR